MFRVACAQASLASLKFHLPFSNLSLAVQRRFLSFSRPPFWPPFCRLALQTIRQTLVLFHLVIRCARLSSAAQYSTSHWSTVQRGAADEEAGTGRKKQVGTRSGRPTSARMRELTQARAQLGGCAGVHCLQLFVERHIFLGCDKTRRIAAPAPLAPARHFTDIPGCPCSLDLTAFFHPSSSNPTLQPHFPYTFTRAPHFPQHSAPLLHLFDATNQPPLGFDRPDPFAFDFDLSH